MQENGRWNNRIFPSDPPPRMGRRHKHHAFLTTVVVTLFISLAVGLWGYIQAEQMEIIKLKHPMPGIDRPVRLIVLSDWHLGIHPISVSKAQEIVKEVIFQKPDIVLMLGDYVDALVPNGVSIDQVRLAFEGLKAPGGVFAVFGNHDNWFGLPQLRTLFDELNFHLLENRSERVELPGATLMVAGVEDDTTGQPDVKRALNRVSTLAPTLLLSHDPVVFEEINPRPNLLTLAGHTHGGQIALPLIGPLTNMSRANNDWSYGWVKRGDSSLYITSGLGTSIFPIRLGTHSEMVVLTLTPAP
ncbi:metallophosphoesterase [Magnetococcus sp. PR-3]|uniref:metallophosphoesterase n=1 Tax=Magnetococcus sp. PR-3 TaxID=3120355 RepID=UPI002FCE6202